MLAQVAASKLVGYYEERMYPWDCLAGLCLISEAKGNCADYGFDLTTIGEGAPVLAGTNKLLKEMPQSLA
jgi:myo-inositol-1(or 4)-monophosphatase